MMMLCAAVSELISCANPLNQLDWIDEREMFMKDIDYSDYYEEGTMEVG